MDIGIEKTYFLAVYENENGGFNGDFADFDCVVDEGNSLDELLGNAEELLGFTVRCMADDSVPVPEASDMVCFLGKLDKEPFCVVSVPVCFRR